MKLNKLFLPLFALNFLFLGDCNLNHKKQILKKKQNQIFQKKNLTKKKLSLLPPHLIQHI